MSVANPMTASLTSNLDYALHYSSFGWEIFPAHTMKDGRCSCGKICKSPGKHPMTRNGLKDATNNRQTILKWWNKTPDANIAIRTGEKSGLVVLDIDTKSNGFESLEILENLYEKLPDTLTSITGSKGNHICFTHPGNKVKTRTNILDGIDFRGDGGYIIAPPSLHFSGNNYYWVDIKSSLINAPEWLINLVNNHDEAVISGRENIIYEGSRNSSLMSFAGKKWSQGISKRKLQTYLLEENALKCRPPLEHSEIMGIVDRVCNYERGEKKFIYTWKKQFRDSSLPSLSKLVLHALSDHMDVTGRSCYPTQEQLSKETSMTRKTIRKHINLCVNEGWVEKYLHNSDHQSYWNHGYIARLPDG